MDVGGGGLGQKTSGNRVVLRQTAARTIRRATAFNATLLGCGGKTGKLEPGVRHGRTSFESGNR